MCHSFLNISMIFHVKFVAGTQPLNAIAFVLDGLYYGVSDFGFAAYSMVIFNLFRSLILATYFLRN